MSSSMTKTKREAMCYNKYQLNICFQVLSGTEDNSDTEVDISFTSIFNIFIYK